MQPPKTDTEIQAMREGGKILAGILRGIRDVAKPGVSEREVDAWVEKEIVRRGAIATYKTEEVQFPGVICISVNDEIVHSPATEYVFKKGDVAKFDLVITYKGMKTDSAFTMVIGEDPKGDVKRLLDATEQSLYAAIDMIQGPVKTGDIGATVSKVLEDAGLGVVKELVGHGIGHEMHMAPEVPNWGTKGQGVLLKPGDTIAIEPMATLGSAQLKLDSDGWTFSTRDGSLSAHFEHTILITKDGAEVLTQI